ncbi:hypothetical protein L7F22_025525 [Adiantum nelumboides]|nr:hypothetical protein [Adiantum nelumboides]
MGGLDMELQVLVGDWPSKQRLCKIKQRRETNASFQCSGNQLVLSGLAMELQVLVGDWPSKQRWWALKLVTKPKHGLRALAKQVKKNKMRAFGLVGSLLVALSQLGSLELTVEEGMSQSWDSLLAPPAITRSSTVVFSAIASASPTRSRPSTGRLWLQAVIRSEPPITGCRPPIYRQFDKATGDFQL